MTGLTASVNFSMLSLLLLFPIALAIWLLTTLLNAGIKKGGKLQAWGIVLSLIVSLGMLGYGGWAIFTHFFVGAFFLAAGGGIILVFTIRAMTYTKEDRKPLKQVENKKVEEDTNGQ